MKIKVQGFLDKRKIEKSTVDGVQGYTNNHTMEYNHCVIKISQSIAKKWTNLN